MKQDTVCETCSSAETLTLMTDESVCDVDVPSSEGVILSGVVCLHNVSVSLLAVQHCSVYGHCNPRFADSLDTDG